jgi:hypothetical protein
MALEAMGTDRVSVTFSVRMGARMIKARDIAFMESFQNTNIKRIFGFPKRFHHTKLLLALDIKGIGALIHSFNYHCIIVCLKWTLLPVILT